jgi:hypothetical protein
VELISRRAEQGDRDLLQDAVRRGRDATTQLRRLGHGRLFDSAGGGLRAALLTLENDHPETLSIVALPDRPHDEAIEAAVFRLLTAVLRAPRHVQTPIVARIEAGDGMAVELDVPGIAAGELADDLTHASARIAALGGSLDIQPASTGVRILARIRAHTEEPTRR